jgi:hypothetical protein
MKFLKLGSGKNISLIAALIGLVISLVNRARCRELANALGGFRND